MAITESQAYQDFFASRKVASAPGTFYEDTMKKQGLDETTSVARDNEIKQTSIDQKTGGQPSAIGEIPKQIVGGALDAVQETINTGLDLADWVENFAATKGIGTGKVIEDADRLDFSEHLIAPPKTFVGGLTRGVTNFLLPFAGFSKAIKIGNTAGKAAKVLRGAGIGALADFTAFDPHEKRLSNLIQRYPELQNPVTAFLAADEGDTKFEGRVKNVLEGMGLGAITEGMILGLKGYRSIRKTNRAVEAKPPKDAPPPIPKEGEEDIAKEAAKLPDENQFIDEPPPLENIDSLEPKGGSAIEISKPATPEDTSDFLARFGREAGDTAVNINLNKISGSDDIAKSLKAIADQSGGQIDEARRGIVTDDQLTQLADELDLTVPELLSRKKGQAFNAEEMIASRKLLNASAVDLINKAKLASVGSDAEKVALMDGITAHKEIQAHVSGAIAESGRALKSLRMVVGMPSDAAKARMIRDIVELHGGSKNVEKMARRISELDGVKDVSSVINKSLTRKLGDAVYETWVNGLLSGPQTHMVNMISGGAAIAGKNVERAGAEFINVLRKDPDGVQRGETWAMMQGMVSGFMDAARETKKTFISGKPSDISTKLDLPVNKAISAEEFGLTGPVGKAVDIMGEIVRIPGRFLISEDEFVKGVNYRMETHALAVRQAVSENLGQKELKELINNPPDAIKLKALNEARVNTFTAPLEGAGESLNSFVKGVPGLKIIAPFIRTNINLVEFAASRNPILAPLTTGFRTAMKNGGAEKDIALAKIGFGGMMMATSGYFAFTGNITGSGPKNPAANKIWKQAGNLPYSAKVGETSFSYDRLDPFGALIGMAADFSELANYVDEARESDLESLAITAAALVGDNLTPEFLTENMATFIDVINGDERVVRNFITGFGRTAVPFSSMLRTIRKEVDPGRRDTSPAQEGFVKNTSIWEEAFNKLKDTIPGMSDKLPPVRNLFGEAIHYNPGYGPDIVSPIATAEQSKSSAFTELVRLGMAGPMLKPAPVAGESHLQVRMPSRVISKSTGAGDLKLQLGPEDYDRLVQLSAGIDLPGVRKTLQQALEHEVNKGYPSLSSRMKESDEAKRLVFGKIISKYQSAGRKAFMLENMRDVKSEFREQGLNKLEAFGVR